MCFLKWGIPFLSLVFFLYIVHSHLYIRPASASHCPATDYDCQIKEIQDEIDALSPAQQKNQQELANLNKQITDIKRRVAGIKSELNDLETDIKTREEDLGLQQELLNVRARSLYIRSRLNSPILIFLASSTASDVTRELAIRQQAAAEDNRIINELSEQLTKLNEDKKKLQSSRASLEGLQKNLDSRATFLSGEVEKVGTYLSKLSGKQSELLALKAGGFSASVGDTPPTLEPCSGPPGSSNFCSPGFGPAFGAFSFGAPHRKGMSQFGAKGRADGGQNNEDILRAYYGNIRIETKGDLPSTINTTAGTLSMEDNYLMGIAEMPSTWHPEALKAQAIAARTYALSYVGYRVANPGGATGKICTTEACQVYSSSKAGNTPSAWRDAVSATRGKVIVSANTNEIFSTWYASTSGGYTFAYSSLGHSTPGEWDTPSGKGGWPDNSYEKKSGSPWFYKGWYRTRSGSNCGRSNPWLTGEEMADVLNAWHVLNKGGGDVSRISPTTTACWPGNPYSVSELASIGGYTSVSNVSVVYGNDGSTQNVGFSTNKGEILISGEEFKKAFNLRAPGYIGIKSSLFNIIKL
ncbi:SpoIID/LytB domain-containing protein [Candidatus Microgenomates bacterium]|nr:SpoIID/LytB domain-containing protein [Candidatus Microgenomates bacterium]